MLVDHVHVRLSACYAIRADRRQLPSALPCLQPHCACKCYAEESLHASSLSIQVQAKGKGEVCSTRCCSTRWYASSTDHTIWNDKPSKCWIMASWRPMAETT